MPTSSPDAALTPAEAEQLHRQAVAARQQPMWFVVVNDPAFPKRHVVRVHTMDHQGGVWLSSAMVADTLAELQAMMPPGLTRRPRAAIDPADVVETWD